MEMVVLLKMVPDVVEELVVGQDGRSLDTEWLRMILSDADDHALEEALLLKERHGGTVVVVAPDTADIDEVLYTALAKGADRTVKIAGEWTDARAPDAAGVIASFLRSIPGGVTPQTLILTGSQAIDDLNGEIGAFLAAEISAQYVAVATGISMGETPDSVVVVKEFSGGLRGEYDVRLPAVVGVQAAEKPPRYVPVARVRAVMKTSQIESVEIPSTKAAVSLPEVTLRQPAETGKAQMLEGSTEDVSVRIAELLAERGLL